MNKEICGPRFRARYKLGRKLGQGGMGSVYLATDERLQRFLAVKFINKNVLDEKSAARFLEEAKIAARLHHRNIVQLFDYDEDEGHPYLAFQFIEGCCLRAFLEDNGPPALAQTKEWMAQLCSAMSAAHAAGIVHRDLKGDNILLDKNGTLLVTDFGLARRDDRTAQLTDDGSILGTPEYIAPELLLGEKPSVASDIYAAGIILYELLTGERPFKNDQMMQLLNAHMKESVPDITLKRPELPTLLNGIVRRAMAKEPEERYQSFQDLTNDLKEVPEQAMSTRERDTITTKLKALSTPAVIDVPTRKKHPLLGVVLIVVFAFIYFLWPKTMPADKALLKTNVLKKDHGFALSWQSERKRRYQFVLTTASGSVVKKEGETANSRKHQFLMQRLAPNTSYSIEIKDQSGTVKKDFKTPALKFNRGVFACSWRGFTYIDFATNWWSDFEVCLHAQGKRYSTRINGSGAAVLLPKGGPILGKAQQSWSISLDGRELLSGPVCRDLPMTNLPRLFEEPYESVPDHRSLFVGEQLLVMNVDGVLSSLSPIRKKKAKESYEGTCLLNWAFAAKPKGFIGGLTTLPDGRCLFTYHRETGHGRTWPPMTTYQAVHLYCLNPKLRATHWRANLYKEPNNPWHKPLSSEEWYLELQELKGCRVLRQGLIVDDILLLPIQDTDMRSGWCAISTKQRKFLWKKWNDYSIDEVPFYISELGKWTKGVAKEQGYLRFAGLPIVVGKSVFSLLNFDWPKTGSLSLITSFTLGEEAPTDMRALFGFNVGTDRGIRLSMTNRDGQLVATGKNHLFVFLVNGKGLPLVHKADALGTIADELSHQFLTGTLFTGKDTWLFLSERKVTKAIIDNVYKDQFAFATATKFGETIHSRGWSTRDISFACEKEVGLFDILCGDDFIISRAIEKLICIDTKNQMASHYTTKGGLQQSVDNLSGDFRLSALGLKDDGSMAAVVTKFGTVEFFPPQLLSKSSRTKLNWSSR